jgi:hypothetical protein
MINADSAGRSVKHHSTSRGHAEHIRAALAMMGKSCTYLVLDVFGDVVFMTSDSNDAICTSRTRVNVRFELSPKNDPLHGALKERLCNQKKRH